MVAPRDVTDVTLALSDVRLERLARALFVGRAVAHVRYTRAEKTCNVRETIGEMS